jgi:anti-sigma regulatory factor (Ser/Thr protein kinase)
MERGATSVTRTLMMQRDAKAPRKAREAAAEMLREVDPRLLPDAQLLLSELMTNAVQYGRGPIELRIESPDPHRIVCAVVDRGQGFTPVARTRPPIEGRGRGLYLVEQLADAWGIRAGGADVWFELSVDTSADAAAV